MTTAHQRCPCVSGQCGGCYGDMGERALHAAVWVTQGTRCVGAVCVSQSQASHKYTRRAMMHVRAGVRVPGLCALLA